LAKVLAVFAHIAATFLHKINGRLGSDVVIFKYFRRKIWRKYWRFLLKLLPLFREKMIITFAFEKNNHIFSPKIGTNRRKL
jgi:hypothetical protein